MSNWCVTNYRMVGDKKEIERFCSIVNSLRDKPDVKPNDFGKLWLGNLQVAMGYEYDEKDGDLRGTIDPDFGLAACWVFQKPSENKFVPTDIDENTAEVVFSTQTAWDISKTFNIMLDEKFPTLRYGYKATDEFGNFHTFHNRDIIKVPSIEIEFAGDDFIDFEPGDEQKAVDLLIKETGRYFTIDEVLFERESFQEKLTEWNHDHKNEEIYVTVWKDDEQ